MRYCSSLYSRCHNAITSSRHHVITSSRNQYHSLSSLTPIQIQKSLKQISEFICAPIFKFILALSKHHHAFTLSRLHVITPSLPLTIKPYSDTNSKIKKIQVYECTTFQVYTHDVKTSSRLHAFTPSSYHSLLNLIPIQTQTIDIENHRIQISNPCPSGMGHETSVTYCRIMSARR